MPAWTDAVYATAALVSAPVWGWRLLRTGKWRTDWPGRLGRCRLSPEDRPTLLLHGVSVGEVNAARRLVEKLEGDLGSDLRIVVSATTDTGVERARALFEPRHEVVRFVFDLTPAVRRLLDAVRPDAVALVELEVWPTFVAECARRGIPVAVINGRLSERSHRRYRLVRGLLRSTFSRLAAAAVQDETYARRFVDLGVPTERMRVTGTMKWDSAEIADGVPGSDALADRLGVDRSAPLVVCGSTGPGEEAMLVDALTDLTAKDASGVDRPIQLLIAPRKPERFGEAAEAMGDPVRRSRCEGPSGRSDDRRLFLLDTIGELRQAYALADVVVVGRSFCPMHGSDMVEPIALGKPTIVGPNTGDFAEMMSKLRAGGGVAEVTDADALRQAVRDLLHPERGRALAERGRKVIREEQGATDRHADLLRALLPVPD